MSDMMKDIDKRNTREMLGNIHIPSSSKEEEEETTRPSDSPHLPKHRRNYTIFTEVRSDSMTQNSSAEELIREDQKSDFVRRHDHETEGTIKYVGWVYKQGAKSLFGIKMVRFSHLDLLVRLKLSHTQQQQQQQQQQQLRPFKLRFLVLTDKSISWYKDASPGQKPLNRISDLTGYIVKHDHKYKSRGGLMLIHPDISKRQFRFYIATKNKLLARAEQTRWTKALLREIGEDAVRAFNLEHSCNLDPFNKEHRFTIFSSVT